MHNPFIEHLDAALMAAPRKVWSEYQLLRVLVDNQQLVADYAQDSLGLFRAHFLVMNALFQLQQRYAQRQLGALRISALEIELKPWGDVESGLPQLGGDQALAQYYLDWQHFRNTDQREVDELLAQFWFTFMQRDQRAQALELLGLDAAASDAEIKGAYRQKAMQLHRDRGGDGKELSQLNEAMSSLKLNRKRDL